MYPSLKNTLAAIAIALSAACAKPAERTEVLMGSVDAIVTKHVVTAAKTAANGESSFAVPRQPFAVILNDGSCGYISPERRNLSVDFDVLQDAKKKKYAVLFGGSREITYGGSPDDMSGIPCTVVDTFRIKHHNYWVSIPGNE